MDRPVSLTTYAVLQAHLRHFPKEVHGEVLRRLDFEPSEWPAYAARGEAALLAAMQAGADTSEFTATLGRLKRELKKRGPTVEELPLDQPRTGPGSDDAPPRTMRLRDIDPVEFLDALSSRLGAQPAQAGAGELATGGYAVMPPEVPQAKGFPTTAELLRPPKAAAIPPLPQPRPAHYPAPPAPVPVAQQAKAEQPSAAELARERTRAAKALFESTKVSPGSERIPAPTPERVSVTVQSSPFAAPPAPEAGASVAATPAASAPSGPDVADEAPPETQMIGPEDAAFPGVQLPALSLFEFANLCAEYNVCGVSDRQRVREKYGVSTEEGRLGLLDVWRTRLVQHTEELAEWKRLYDAATRHWQQLYRAEVSP